MESHRRSPNPSQQSQSPAEWDGSPIPFPSVSRTSSYTHDVKPIYRHSLTWPPPSSALGLETYESTPRHDRPPSLPPINTPPPLELSLTWGSTPPPRPSHIRSPAQSVTSRDSLYGDGYARSTRPSLSPVVEETSSNGSRSPRSPQTSDPPRPSADFSSRHGGRRHRWSRLSTSETNRRSSSSWILDDTTNNGRGFVTFEDDLMQAILAIAPPHVKKAPQVQKKRSRFHWCWKTPRAFRFRSKTRRNPRDPRADRRLATPPDRDEHSFRSFSTVGRKALDIARSFASVMSR